MNLKTYGFDRFGDIWAGVILKKIADHLGYSINSGSPAIKHLRASNVWANLRKEAPGLGINETFWAAVDAVPLRGSTFRECYREIANGIEIEVRGAARVLPDAEEGHAHLDGSFHRVSMPTCGRALTASVCTS